MKTIRPINITADKSLINSVKRAINNASLNCSIVNLIVDKINCLVYPQDDMGKVLSYVKIQQLQSRIAELSA
jgi:hypothetical protein